MALMCSTSIMFVLALFETLDFTRRVCAFGVTGCARGFTLVYRRPPAPADTQEAELRIRTRP